MVAALLMIVLSQGLRDTIMQERVSIISMHDLYTSAPKRCLRYYLYAADIDNTISGKPPGGF